MINSNPDILHRFCHGEQEQISLISYEGLSEQPDHLLVDDTYIRCLYVSGYPFVASSGWLDNLINFNRNIDIAYHIQEIDVLAAIPKLERKITELESTKRAMIKSGKIIGTDLTDPLDSAIDIKNKLQRGQEKLFQVSINISLRAPSLNELDNMTQLIESVLASRLFFVKNARYAQIDALQTVLPRAEDKLSQKRNMDSTTASLCFPFSSAELVHESGILYGVNLANSSLVMLDRFSLNNANSITFAQSGSGKSYASKVEILRQLMQGVDVIVIDPEREYQKLAESVNGASIRLAIGSSDHINPFDLRLNGEQNRSVPELTRDLLEIISLMAGGLTSREQTLTDKLIIGLYSVKGQAAMPTLGDFHRRLLAAGETALAEKLDKYVSGSLGGMFNVQTNINLNNRLVVFDIKDSPEDIRQIMMMIISGFVQSRVQSSLKKRLLVIDEGWLLLEHEQSARFVSGLVRRARKYWLGVALISQQANDFLLNDYGKAIASQSALRILMRQDTTTIKNVVTQFQLSEYEQNFLLTCDRGEALIIADLNHVAVSVVASETEHPLITTDPSEVIQQVRSKKK
jgi:type IV secretory pathway VirB4 component